MADKGRPTDYTQEIADVICSRMAEGESLRAICRDDDMPNRSTVHRWLADEDKQHFRDQYARAAEDRADAMFEDLIEIADEPLVGEKTVVKGDGKVETTTGDCVDRSKLKVDARKWALARMMPKKYGDKLNVEATGKDGKDLPPQIVQVYVPSNGRD